MAISEVTSFYFYKDKLPLVTENSGPSIKRLRWDATEKSRFRETLGAYITNSTMPDGKALTEAAKVLPDRTVAQIRTRMHNIISGKLVNY